MDRWEYYNPNPVKDKRTGDCVVRAICKEIGYRGYKNLIKVKGGFAANE